MAERPESSPDDREKELRELEVQLGHEFDDRTLLETALCHSSYANENPGVSDNASS